MPQKPSSLSTLAAITDGFAGSGSAEARTEKPAKILSMVECGEEPKPIEREAELFSFYRTYKRLPSLTTPHDEELKLARYFARKKNQSDSARAFLEHTRAELRDKRNEEEVLLTLSELTAFCKQNSRWPRKSSQDPAECKLLARVNNCLKPGNGQRFSKGQRNEIARLKNHYIQRKPRAAKDLLRELENHCINNQSWPSSRSNDPSERRVAIYFSSGANVQLLDSAGQKRFVRLKKKYGRYSYKDMRELTTDYVQFCRQNSRTPSRSSQEASESRLAREYNKAVKEKKLSEQQQIEIHKQRTAVKRAGGISLSEKLLVCALRTALQSTGAVIQPNVKVGSSNVDAFIELRGRSFAVQYDGGIHNGKDQLTRDHRADAINLQGGATMVIRIREKSLPPYEEAPGIKVLIINRPFSDLVDQDKLEAIMDLLVLMGEDNPSKLSERISWEKARKQAVASSSHRQTVVRAIANYYNYVRLHQAAHTSAQRKKVIARLRKYKAFFSLEDFKDLACFERKYDTGKHLLQDWLDEFLKSQNN